MSKSFQINYAIYENGVTSVLIDGDHFDTFQTPSEALLTVQKSILTFAPEAELHWIFDAILPNSSDSDSEPKSVDYLTLVSDSEE